MLYKGFCDKQNKNYSVKITQINASAYEDLKSQVINGRFDCQFSGLTGCCPNGVKDCSIVKNLIK